MGCVQPDQLSDSQFCELLDKESNTRVVARRRSGDNQTTGPGAMPFFTTGDDAVGINTRSE